MKHCIPRAALSALLALALCAGPLTVPALAEEVSSSASQNSAQEQTDIEMETQDNQNTSSESITSDDAGIELLNNGMGDNSGGDPGGNNEGTGTGEEGGTGGGSGSGDENGSNGQQNNNGNTNPGGGNFVETTPAPDGVYVVAAAVTDPAGGEIPTIEWGDRVNVVLSVLDHSSAQYDIAPEQISARVNSSTFTFTGNGEIGQLVEGEDDNGPYYSYNLLFRDVIYNGGGNTFPVNLSYIDSTLPMQQFSVTLGQCVDEDPNDPSDARAPSLIVRGASYGTETITAGSPFTLSLTLYASNGTESVADVVASLTLPEGVTMTGGNLSSYVGTMAPQSSSEVSFSIQTSAGFTGGVANITVNLAGAGAVSGNAVTGTTTISVPISQPDRFELGELQVNDTIYLGDTATVTLNFVNKGRNPVANIEASITGEGLGAEMTQQYIGNLNAGTENSVDFDLLPTQVGPVSGSIVLTYEAEDGSIKTASKDFSFSVEEMPVYDDTMMDPGMMEPAAQPGLPVWGIVLIAVLAVVIVVVVIVVIRRKKKKAAALADLEGEDEDL